MHEEHKTTCSRVLPIVILAILRIAKFEKVENTTTVLSVEGNSSDGHESGGDRSSSRASTLPTEDSFKITVSSSLWEIEDVEQPQTKKRSGRLI